jgi:hypothetical protein
MIEDLQIEALQIEALQEIEALQADLASCKLARSAARFSLSASSGSS